MKSVLLLTLFCLPLRAFPQAKINTNQNNPGQQVVAKEDCVAVQPMEAHPVPSLSPNYGSKPVQANSDIPDLVLPTNLDPLFKSVNQPNLPAPDPSLPGTWNGRFTL